MSKITLLAENLYIIRSTSTYPDGCSASVRYYVTPSTWTVAPTKATLFLSYEAGEAHLTMYHYRDKSSNGWADGRTEVLDVVPLYGEVLTSPNSTIVDMKKD